MELKAKRKKTGRHCVATKSFPIKNINSNEDATFTGYFNGLSVEIFDDTAMRTMYENGCFGISSITKAAPVFRSDPAGPSKVKKHFDKRTVKRKNKHTEECERNIEIITNTTSTIRKKEPETSAHIAKDPFPLSESLILFLEEAFFLHFSLKCLNVLDLNQCKIPTEQLFELFCSIKSTFPLSFIAYQYYRSKNWSIKCGLKFGVLYEKGPRYSHAAFVVLVRPTEMDGLARMSGADLHGHCRIAENSKKDVLIVEVSIPQTISQSSPMDFLENISMCTVSEMIPKRFNVNLEK